MARLTSQSGFTLVELMVVVAILGILAGAAIPQFANIADKAHDGATRGNLGILRSAIALYSTDNDGKFPLDDLTSLETGHYIQKLPSSWTRVHQAQAGQSVGGAAIDDAHWIYGNSPNDPNTYNLGSCVWGCTGMPMVCGTTCNFNVFPGWGQIFLNCTHNDMAGVAWNMY